MNPRMTASIAGSVGVALMALSGCADEEPSREETAEFAVTWSKLSSEDRKTACWANTAQALPDQQAQAMAFLSETFGKNWTRVSGLIEKKC